MCEIFTTIKKQAKAEIVIKKSRFIAEVFYVETEKEAQETIHKIEKREHSAKHHCFAYRVFDDKLIERMSDDGEPSGTAGSPMLAILQAKELINVVAVVTRYFGGTLLGTGGLVRAYSDSLTKAIEEADIKKIQKGSQISIEIDYSNLEQLKYYLGTIGGRIISSEYENSVKSIIEIPNNYTDDFTINYQNLPFKIKKSKFEAEKYVDI